MSLLKFFALLFFAFTFLSCDNKNNDSTTSCTGSQPSGVSSAPTMTFYVGNTTDATGTALTATGQISGIIAASGCGPFGIWESGNGGEVATEIEMRLTTRKGVFAMADGVVVNIQSSSSPLESGEVEGIHVRYGDAYVIKYVHVKDPTVSVGQAVTSGDRLGVMVNMGGGQYFWEAEVRNKSSGTTYAVAWNSLLSNAATFNSLYGAGNCAPSGTIYDTDGTTATTASNWKNNSIASGTWNVTGTDVMCAFP